MTGRSVTARGLSHRSCRVPRPAPRASVSRSVTWTPSSESTGRFRQGIGGRTHGRGGRAQHGKPRRWRGARQPHPREGQAGPVGVAERSVRLKTPGNAGRGKGPQVWSDVGSPPSHGTGSRASASACPTRSPGRARFGCRAPRGLSSTSSRTQRGLTVSLFSAARRRGPPADTIAVHWDRIRNEAACPACGFTTFGGASGHVGREPAHGRQAARASAAQHHGRLCTPCRCPPRRDRRESRKHHREGDADIESRVQRTGTTSVRGKSLPLNNRDSPVWRASAYAQQSPRFKPAGCRPLP